MTAIRRVWGVAALLAAVAYLRHQTTFAVLGAHEASTLRQTALSAKSQLAAGRGASKARAALVPRKQAMDSPAVGVLPNLDLTGKVAVVTGAGRGIGQQIADKLRAAGATVVGTDITDEAAEAISERYGEFGMGVKMNVAKDDEIKAGMKLIEEKYGGVDILINNAGITKDNVFMRMKDEEWDAVIQINLNSVFKMTKACLKYMTKKKWGRIVSIASVVGSMGNAGQTNYAASKAGINGFSRALAREVGSRGITVNTVAPGFIDTAMTQGLKDEWKQALLQQVPLGRLGQPEEIADAVLWLASPAAGYISGLTMHVNGGMYMM